MQKHRFCKRIFEILSQNIMVVDNSELAKNPFLVMKKLEPFLNISSFFAEGRVANEKDRVLLVVTDQPMLKVHRSPNTVPCSDSELRSVKRTERTTHTDIVLGQNCSVGQAKDEGELI